MPHTPMAMGGDQPNTGNHIVKAWLPNQQRTTVSISPGMTIREALLKALKLRKLEPNMCTVFRLSPDGQTKQRIDWDVEVSMLKGDEILVENKDKVPMHTQLSHNFAKLSLNFRLCHFCQGSLMTKGIKCLTCNIEFHRNCSNSTQFPKLCEPAIDYINYHKHLLARPSGFSPTNPELTSKSPTNSNWPIRPRARSADENSRHKSGKNHNHDSTANQTQRTHHQILEEKWEIDAKEITILSRIGQGSFATVYEGYHYGPVALKKLNVKNPSDRQLRDFKNEVAVLKKTRHPNILLFQGYVLRPEFMIVTQLCKGRSLYKHLHVEEIRTFTSCEIHRLALDIAQGMEYLHAKNIIHRDLKSNNIFIHDEIDLTVRIGDFGLATFKTTGEGDQKIYHPTGSILWMAPEVIRTRQGVNPFTFAADVYSYGMVLYELMSKKLPYYDYEFKDGLPWLIGTGDPRLKLNLDVIPPDTPDGLIALMSICKERDREKRPQFTSIMRDLKKIRLSRSNSEPLRLNNLDFLAKQSNDFV